MKFNGRHLICYLGAFFLAAPVMLGQRSRFEFGRALYNDGQYPEALQQLNASKEAGEDAPLRPLYQGMCLGKLGKWPEASTQFLVYLKSHPTDAGALNLLGQAQFHLHQFEQARQSAQRAIQLDGKFADAYRLLGEAALELRDYDGAYRAWLSANKLNPHDAQTAYYLGRLFYEANFFNEAAAWLREALQREPTHFAAMTYLGLSAEGLGMADTAVQLYRRAIQESKSQAKPFSWAFLSLAKLLRDRDQDAEALRVLEEAEKTCPEPHLLATLGQMLVAANQPQRAEALLRRAIEMDSSISEAHYSLSLLLRAAGRLDDAKIETEKFLKAKEIEKQRQSDKMIAIREN